MNTTKSLRVIAIVSVIYAIAYLSAQHYLTASTSAHLTDTITVVIDAGHGGEDGGAVSTSGIRESELNLAVALRLEQILALCGINSFMIRSDDRSVYTEGDTVHARKMSDLKQRVLLVHSQIPCVLVSIHQNHFDEPKYDGAQVFYSAAEGSKILAQLTQETLRETLDPQNQREIKQAETVYLLEKTNCTGILVECGFLSNPNEALLLQQEHYQTKIACAIGSALSQFLEEGTTDEV